MQNPICNNRKHVTVGQCFTFVHLHLAQNQSELSHQLRERETTQMNFELPNAKNGFENICKI